MAIRSTVGTRFLRGDAGSPELFTTVAQVTQITPPAAQLTMLDASDLESTHMQRAAGVIDSGEGAITLNFDPDIASHIALRSDLESRATHNYAVVFPDFGATQKTVDNVNTTTEVVETTAAHGLITGQAVQFATSDTLPDGLSVGVTYFVNVATSTTFTAHATNAAAVAGTGAIDIGDAGTGTHTVELPSRWDFAAFVNSFVPGADVNDKLTATISVTVTGSVTS